jgi:hypothetical protein
MKELNNLECQEINGGGPVFRWAGHVVYHILDFIQKDLNYADSYLLGPNSRAIM